MSELLAGSRESGVPAAADVDATAARLGVSARTVRDRLGEAIRAIEPAGLDEAAQEAAAAARSAAEAIVMLRRLGSDDHAAALFAAIGRTPARHAARRWASETFPGRAPRAAARLP